MTVRLYGKILDKWYSVNENGRKNLIQKEIEYKEYDIKTGALVAIGTEDFSCERFKQQIISKYVHVWDGVKFNNRGQRKFEDKGMIAFRKEERKNLVEYLKNKYNDYVLIQLR